MYDGQRKNNKFGLSYLVHLLKVFQLTLLIQTINWLKSFQVSLENIGLVSKRQTIIFTFSTLNKKGLEIFKTKLMWKILLREYGKVVGQCSSYRMKIHLKNRCRLRNNNQNHQYFDLKHLFILIGKFANLNNLPYICKYISLSQYQKLESESATMSQCNFCSQSDPSIDQICCCDGQLSCADCIVSRRVNESTVCMGCKIALRKKFTGLLARIQLNLQSHDGRNRNMGTRNYRQEPDMEPVGNMINTLKKTPGFKGNQNQNQCYQDNFGNYMPAQSALNPSLYSNYGMPPAHYQGPYYGYINAQMPPMYGPMTTPMNMMQPNPQFNSQNFNPSNNPNSNQGRYLSAEQYQIFTQMRMLKNASKGIMPYHMSPEQDERGQGRYWHGEHNDVVYNSRNQSKTTDMMEQSTAKSKLGKMSRSNSLTSLSLQR